MTDEKDKQTPEGAAPAGTPAAVDEKPKQALLSVYAQVQYLCPSCGEIVLATDEKSTKDGTNELELTPENGYRDELPELIGTCDACKIPVYRQKIILFYHGKRSV